jgi:glutamyl-tRNA reductase
MAELAAVALRSRGAGDIVIANRTLSRAESLAARVGGRAAALDALREELAAADVVVSCTSSRSFVVSPAALERRGARPLLLIDLALPRDVDPGVASLDGHRLFDLDDLARIVGSTLEFRRSEAQRAEAIVHEEAEKFRLWRHSLPAVPAVVALRRHAEAIRTSVLERRAGELAALGARERELVESVTSQIVARLLHAPTIELKSGGPDAKAVERLFALQPAISPVRSGDGALG